MKIEMKKETAVTTTTKKYSGVYAMGDAPIVVRGLIKVLDLLDLDGQIKGVNPRNSGEKLAVILAVALKEIIPNGVDVKDLASVMRTIDGERKKGLWGRGEAQWEDITLNEMVSQYLAPSADNAETKKNKKK